MPLRTVIDPHTSHAGASPMSKAFDWSSTLFLAIALSVKDSPVRGALGVVASSISGALSESPFVIHLADSSCLIHLFEFTV